MLKRTLLAMLSLSMATSICAAPIAIPFTGMTADVHMKKNSIVPIIAIRVSHVSSISCIDQTLLNFTDRRIS